MIRAVLLDALGTVLELEQPAPLLVAELRTRGVDVSVEEAHAAVLAEIAYYRSHHDEASDRERLADLRRRCTEVLRSALPPRAQRLDADELGAALLAALRFRPYPEVSAALAALRAAGARMVVVSNWDVSLHEQLAATGLAPLVDGALSSAELGIGKPEPEIFRRALELAGARAEDALMVGDSLDTDIRGAEAVGIAAVLVDRDGSAGTIHEPTIPTLAALPGLVQSFA